MRVIICTTLLIVVTALSALAAKTELLCPPGSYECPTGIPPGCFPQGFYCSSGPLEPRHSVVAHKKRHRHHKR